MNGMKILKQFLIVFSLLNLITFISVAQIKSLVDRETQLKAKVQIGMSTDEVKKSIGRPKAVESGFPDSDELIITSLPQQNGQLNNSTWFYYYSRFITVPRIENGDTLWYINGLQVEKEVYKSYLNMDVVYFRDNQVIDSALGAQYEFFNNKSASKRPKDKETTHFVKEKDQKMIDTVAPILCVIFDRGTNVVADIKVYFLRIGTKKGL